MEGDEVRGGMGKIRVGIVCKGKGKCGGGGVMR